MSVNDSILIIGHPSSGKTTFIAQFLTRVKKRKSSISLIKAPENIKAVADAVKKLSNGEAPTATPAGENEELVLSIQVGEKSIDLVCPDYGGEQVSDMTELMTIDDHWKKLLNNSDRWVLFIRAHTIMPRYDLSRNSYEKIDNEKHTSLRSPGLSEQSKFIELLQSMLHIKNIGLKHPISMPTISIVLTCWDELETNETPAQVLQDKLPMLLHFVETVWEKDSFEIFGLSAQEFPLNTIEAKDKYLDDLPESFGYVVDQNGAKDKDITKLVAATLNL
ncbi:hypothetical protein Ga0123461_2297 [Mariprofundus aestuarium]|uniref:Double-GTPase 1 domain-containing protein n=1 Tax=Mariprofundus aestuarium TaxID=1921086 RepID=A0A2K8L089_MARES|nr:hypothetical protein [Mariprofundus aestuarium]ATX80698.1 hypothetical protein Ga0123461_2297 [Mariprofundus aestuarium]